MKRLFSILVFCNMICMVSAQDLSNSTNALHNSEKTVNTTGRKWVTGGVMVAGLGSSLIWNYKSMNYERRKEFYQKNDIKAWLQVDKAQHAFIGYTVSRLSSELWQWSGMKQAPATIAGSAAAVSYLIIKEYEDGHNANGGWSWGDVGADIAGAALFAVQEFAWKQQVLYLKVSANRKNYDPSLQARTEKLFGSSNSIKRLLKDYNAQTYWLSGNLHSLFHFESFPAWINLSVGLGADNMFGTYANVVYNSGNGAMNFDRSDIKRYRQWYIAPDIDLTKIKTNKKVLKTVFSVFNTIKIPAPAIEISKGRLKGHFLYF